MGYLTAKYIGIGNNIQGKAYMREGITQHKEQEQEARNGNKTKGKETKGKGRA